MVDPATHRLVVHGAERVWTGRRELPGATVVLEGATVSAVGDPPAPAPPPTVDRLDATGCVVTPGLVNAHHHLVQSALRTLPGTRHVPMATWLATMSEAYRRVGLDPEMLAAAARVGLAESLLRGVTTVADHHLNWPDPLPGDGVELATATADAADEVGARLVFVRGSAGEDPEVAARSADAVATALGARGIQVGVGPAGVHSDAARTFELMAEVAARHGLRRRTQANEHVDVERALARYGRRPLDLLEDWGWLGPDVTLAHLCAVEPDEVDRIAATGTTATHAPAADLALGWGVSPVGELRARGVAVGMGTSGGGSNDGGHLLADARLAMQVSALAGAVLDARTVLAMATLGSAAGLGRVGELGELEPGAAADLCCWDVTGVADAGVADPVAGLVWADPGRRPRHVVVAGRVVVRDHCLVVCHERDLAEDLRRLLARRSSPTAGGGSTT